MAPGPQQTAAINYVTLVILHCKYLILCYSQYSKYKISLRLVAIPVLYFHCFPTAAIQYEPCGSASVAVVTCSGANRYHTMIPRTSHHHSSHAHHSMAHSHHGVLHAHSHASHHASGQSHHASGQSHHASGGQSHHASGGQSHHASGGQSSQHASGHSHHHGGGGMSHSHHASSHNNHQEHGRDQAGMRPEQARKIHIVEGKMTTNHGLHGGKKSMS